jgi:hypothetical protein
VNLSKNAMLMNGRVFMVMMALTASLVLIQAAGAQTGNEPVALSIRLRAADGSPVAGEPVTLQRLPDEEPILPACTTDAQGTCTWYVGRGLYQVLFERPLDEVSALDLAEGGLQGFGLTVGEAPIAYHFTLHNDGHVYFDAAPEAASPAPVIPTLDLLHGGVEPTPSLAETLEPEPTDGQVVEQLPLDSDGVDEDNVTQPPAKNDKTASERRWRLALLVGLGLVVGGGVHLLRHRIERVRKGGQVQRATGTTDQTEEPRA